MATTKIPAYTTLNHAASIEMPLLTGANTRNSAQATTTSSTAAKYKLTPKRNTLSESMMSLAVLAASPCVTSNKIAKD